MFPVKCQFGLFRNPGIPNPKGIVFADIWGIPKPAAPNQEKSLRKNTEA